MAALCPGVQYGLSSQQNFGENKDLIFVKLTDSALRAIEEYIKNQNKFSIHNPTIKFVGNENGELSFPSLHHSSGSTSFSFSMSSTADMEGQGGSFECIKQVGSFRSPLEGLGSIPYKIRIHANDDVYEVTRNRMTEAEDKYKNKCTREIKPNQTDIGRKVKVKQTRPPVLPVRREMLSMRDSLLKQPSYQSNVPSKPTHPLMHSSTNGLSNGLGSNHVSSSRPQPPKKPSVPDIARRPLRERLIHLLALKPFKKFELLERLLKEGIREKSSTTSMLKQISQLRSDNCFHLNRALWNEVQEDWPFYSESEKQILKRRKPQNLTPPGSSDGGSSGSGQSPTSTHPGSPPPPPTPVSSKRPGYHDGHDSVRNKRQRIAHSNKQVDQVYRPPIENNSQRRPITDSRDASNMNPRSRESPTGSFFGSVNGYTNGMLNSKRSLSDDEEEEEDASSKTLCDSHSLSVGTSREKTFVRNRSSSPANKIMVTDNSRKEIPTDRQNGVDVVIGRVRQEEKERERERSNKNDKVTSAQNSIARVSPDSQTEGLPAAELDSPSSPKTEEQNEYPDYKKLYVTIKDLEQRRRYKTDFNADYAEYRDLHGIVEKVSRRFAELEERLKREGENSSKHKDIKKQIVREYHENKKDLQHHRAKHRFQYLHDKLSHIKQLVHEYDTNMLGNQY